MTEPTLEEQVRAFIGRLRGAHHEAWSCLRSGEDRMQLSGEERRWAMESLSNSKEYLDELEGVLDSMVTYAEQHIPGVLSEAEERVIEDLETVAHTGAAKVQFWRKDAEGLSHGYGFRTELSGVVVANTWDLFARGNDATSAVHALEDAMRKRAMKRAAAKESNDVQR